MMRTAKVLLVGVMSLSLAGCVLSGKQKASVVTPTPPQPTAPAPPPEPLSIPQTTVDLPTPQPVEPDALNTVEPTHPTTPAQSKQQPPKAQGRATGASSVPAPLAPLPKAPETPAAPEPTPEPARAPLQELLPAEEQNRLRDSAHINQAEARKVVLTAVPKNSNQRRTKAEIEQFIKQSEQAEGAGDWRLANQFAERANLLAKELQSGK